MLSDDIKDPGFLHFSAQPSLIASWCKMAAAAPGPTCSNDNVYISEESGPLPPAVPFLEREKNLPEAPDLTSSCIPLARIVHMS